MQREFIPRAVQVVMRLLGDLQGITPATYPRVPFEIVNTLTLKAGLGQLEFVMVRSDQAPLPVPTASTSTCAVARAGNANDTADSAHGTIGAAAGAHEATPTPQDKQREKRQRQEEAQKGAYRGRARVGGVWLSSTCYGDSRRVVKVRCGEQVLRQLRRDRHWLQQVIVDGGVACGVRDGPEVHTGAAAPGSAGGAGVHVSATGSAGGASGSGAGANDQDGNDAAAEVALPSLKQMQQESDAPLDEKMAKYARRQ